MTQHLKNSENVTSICSVQSFCNMQNDVTQNANFRPLLSQSMFTSDAFYTMLEVFDVHFAT